MKSHYLIIVICLAAKNGAIHFAVFNAVSLNLKLTIKKTFRPTGLAKGERLFHESEKRAEIPLQIYLHFFKHRNSNRKTISNSKTLL